MCRDPASLFLISALVSGSAFEIYERVCYINAEIISDEIRKVDQEPGGRKFQVELLSKTQRPDTAKSRLSDQSSDCLEIGVGLC